MKRLPWILAALWMPAAAIAQPFAGIHYGQTEARAICAHIDAAAHLIAAEHCDDTDAGWGVRIGYRFNPHVSLEASYIDLGTATAGTLLNHGFAASELALTANATGLGMGLSAHAPVKNDIEVIGQLGIMHWNADLETRATMPGFALTETWSESGISAWFAAGAALRLRGPVWARAMYRRYVRVADSDVDMWSMGVEYRL